MFLDSRDEPLGQTGVVISKSELCGTSAWESAELGAEIVAGK